MRIAFVNTLLRLAEEDPRILLLTGDLGFMVLEPFRERFPGRFFNLGVAEQNMIGVASGLADSGFLPFVYTIVTFAVLRPYEFLRNGPVAQKLPVRIVGVGGGFEYGHAGWTHHGLEDVAVTRVHPNLTVIVPADSEQTASAVHATWDLPGPVYYRLGKDEKARVPGLQGRFQFGKPAQLRRGKDLLVLAMGAIAGEACQAVERVAAQGLDCAMAVISTLNPVLEAEWREWLIAFPHIVTVEEHYSVGGLGSLVAEIVAGSGVPCRVSRIGIDQAEPGLTGSQRYLRRQHGLDAESIARRILSLGVARPTP